MIHLTEAAQKEMERIIAQEGDEARGIRLGVKGGGCSGFSYVMDFEKQAREGDQVLNDQRVPIFVDYKSMAYLDGVEIDFLSDILNRGFKFTNPNASKSCGCGTSFAV
jgi:iron-sulfur cluster assembly protein